MTARPTMVPLCSSAASLCCRAGFREKMFSPNPRVGSDGDRAWFRFTGEDDVAVEAKSAEVAGWLVVLGWYRTGSSDDASEEEDGLVTLETDPESWGSEDGEVSTMRRRTMFHQRDPHPFRLPELQVNRRSLLRRCLDQTCPSQHILRSRPGIQETSYHQ